MDNETKKSLCGRYTLEGIPCNVAGWMNELATVSPRCGGFWHTGWEVVKKVAENQDRNFTYRQVSFSSWGWIGDGTEMPEVLKLKTY